MKKKILQLRIEIKGIKPPIWRRILVEDNITFLDLHKIIQIAFDWKGYHLYHFSPDNYDEVRILSMEDEFYEPLDLLDFLDLDESKDYEESKTKLNKFLKKEKDKMVYCYDYGDNWEHLIKVEKILDFDKKVKYPVCIKGKRAAPLEDIGGVYGYYDFMDALQDENHEMHDDYIEMGYKFYMKEFDAEEFDLDKINEKLKDYKKFGVYEEDDDYNDEDESISDNMENNKKIIDFSDVKKFQKNKKK
ncbi:plasmid pRiA4b ORF-3 family protein [Haliovirga abyssi]|uniref:Plasmid pRiA4b ORF-3 family protein n=1 Tax=Haliovirga abyssi TaxID=2996794 RepID=A0AAU9DN92_9FUSO|nr:plasmid pRiA4b ORF-3 family protein [Haliovirga abyssi]BDU51537.1 plasmid pRiA4b ORF-3 family protein [Haliovirga abyssi]